MAASTTRGNAEKSQPVSRTNLLVAARTVFETSGYSAARVADIVELAGLSHGSFYSYFPNKEMIFRALADDVIRDIVRASASTYRGPDPGQRIASGNRNYLTAFRDNARMMAVVEEVATINESFATFRRGLWSTAVLRVHRSMERDRKNGFLPENLNLSVVSYALVGMVERFAFTWFVLGVQFDWEEAISHLTGMWLRAGGYRLDADGRVQPW